VKRLQVRSAGRGCAFGSNTRPSIALTRTQLIRTGAVPPRSTVTCLPSTFHSERSWVADACQFVASLSPISLSHTCAADTSSSPLVSAGGPHGASALRDV
jgi:hypothetical protein